MTTKTVGLTGRNYSTLAAWAAYANALSLAAHEILEVYNDGGAVLDTSTVTVGGWVANGFNVIMRPGSGQGFKDHANRLTNALRWDASNGAALTNSVGYAIAYVLNGANLTVEDLQFRSSSASASGCVQGRGSAVINRCIVRASSGGYAMPQTHACTVNDSLLLNNNGGGIQVSGDSLVVNNCTLASIGGAGTGIQQSYTQGIPPLVKNTVLFNHTTDVQGTCASGTTNNATSKSAIGGTGWGTNVRVNVSSADFENVSSGTEDFRIKAGSTKLIGTGVASVGSGFDVVNTARSVSTPSIGAWESASASGTPAGLATETDTALALAAKQIRAAGLAAETDTALALTSSAGFDFHTADGLIFGDLAGALTGLAREAAVGMVLRVYAVASPGALVHESGTLTTDSNGRLPRYTHASLSAEVTYHCLLIRNSDGEVLAVKLQAH